MKNKKRILSVSLILALVAVIAGGTLAYFTDTTDTEKNVFTVGKVDIKLTEPSWEKDFVGHIVPDRKIDKDPTITVNENSEETWVFMDVEMNKYASFLKLVGLNEGWTGDDVWNKWEAAIGNGSYTDILDRWFSDIKHKEWKVMNLGELQKEMEKMASGENPTRLTLELGYKTVLEAGEEVTLYKALTVPRTVTSEMIEDSKFNSDKNEWRINITGKAIQAEGIESLDEAYEALYK